jgi:hypothetical protein
MCVCGH